MAGVGDRHGVPGSGAGKAQEPLGRRCGVSATPRRHQSRLGLLKHVTDTNTVHQPPVNSTFTLGQSDARGDKEPRIRPLEATGW